jgi:hypothetical protein
MLIKKAMTLVLVASFVVSCGDGSEIEKHLPSYFYSSAFIRILFPYGLNESIKTDPMQRVYRSYYLKSSQINQNWLRHLGSKDVSIRWKQKLDGQQNQVLKGTLTFDQHEIYGSHILYQDHPQKKVFKTSNVEEFFNQNLGFYSFQLPFPKDETQEKLKFHKGFFTKEDVKRYTSQEYLIDLDDLTFRGTVWFPEGDHLVLAYLFHLGRCGRLSCEEPDLPHQVILSSDTGEVLSQSPLFFHSFTGTSKIYPSNPKEEARKSVELVRLKDPTALQGEYWEVHNCFVQKDMGLCRLNLKSQDGDFGEPEVTDETYDEINGYYSVGKTFDWQLDLHHKTKSKWAEHTDSLGIDPNSPMKILVRALTSARDQNGDIMYSYANAAYLPYGPKGNSGPEILVGPGWEDTFDENDFSEGEKTLTYLGKDADVFIHEFNHHVIFKAVTEINLPETISIHEGLADYMTYSMTNNNLLAESVMSSGIPLRRGDLENLEKLVFGHKPQLKDVFPSQNRLIYLAGEYLSAVLWDLRNEMGLWKEGFYKFDYISHLALEFLVKAARYYDLIGALALASDEFSVREGEDLIANRLQIFNLFHQYGYLEKPTEDGKIPAPTEILKRYGTSSDLQASYDDKLDRSKISLKNEKEINSKKRKFFGLCGSLAHLEEEKKSISEELILIIFFLIFLISQIHVWIKTQKQS